MSKLEVLVTTMHQTDASKYIQMNLQTDAVIANQCDMDEYYSEIRNGNRIQFVSTTSRGTSRNRNIALAHASQKAEYLMFSDDDLVFIDGYEEKVLAEFEKHPEAEVIKFNLHDLSQERKISMKRIKSFEKATKLNMASSGVCGLVLKVESVKKHNLHFNENFGPGTENYNGEDTIFLMDILNKKLKFYRSPVDIAGIDQTESSWFSGHNERYYTTAGMVIGTVYPLLSYIIVIRSAVRAFKRKETNMSFIQILKCYYTGIKKIQTLSCQDRGIRD